MMSKNILIIGGSGYLGVRIAEMLLEEGHKVRVMMRKERPHKELDAIDVEKAYGDISSQKELESAMEDIDVVFHTVGVISYNPAKNALMHQTNVVGTLNVAIVADRVGIERLIYTSSTAAIGVNYDPSKTMNEDSEFNARPLGMAYFTSKYDGEQELKKFTDLDYVVVNPGSILGPRDRRRYEQAYAGLIYKFNPPILFPGGNCFVDIEDAARGHILAWQRGRRGERYILGGENLSFADLVRRTNKIIGRKSPRFTLPVSLMSFASLCLRVLGLFGVKMHITPELVSRVGRWHLYMDSSKAERELGYEASNVDASLKATLDWLKAEGRIK